MRFPKLTRRPAQRPGQRPERHPDQHPDQHPARPHDGAPPADAGRKPRLILHAGTPKTGTTAIQFALARNRDHLAAAGIWYPPVTAFFPVDPKLASANAHFAFANAVADFSAKDQNRLSRLVDTLRDNADRYGTIILSAESIYRLTARPDPRDTTVRDRRMRFLERLATVTEGFDTEILLYLRRVDRFAESLYAETIVQTGKTWPFQQFLNNRTRRFGYRAQIDQFKAHFPVRVRSFDAAAETGLIPSFCADVGIPGALPETAERRRPSVPNAGVLWLRMAKAQAGPMADVARNRRWHFALRPENTDLFEPRGRRGLWKDRAARDAFIERYQADVSEITFPDPESTFTPRARWTEARHAEAERRFHAWQKANEKALRIRERNRIPPYVLDR